MSTLRGLSRCEYSANDTIPNRDELKLGALQRIADATEAMAKRHTELIRERDMYARFYDEQCDRAGKLERSNAALRGQITRLRKKLAARDAGEHLPALLDCAEVLQAVLATLEWQAHGGCRATDGPLMSSADAVAMGKAALARLNGGDHA